MNLSTTNPDKVLLPLIRSVIPNVIANSIVGVQPMSGPSGLIHTLRARYTSRIEDGIKMDNTCYRYFTRAYNRRKYHPLDYLSNLGYPGFTFTCSSAESREAQKWCAKNLPYGSAVWDGRSVLHFCDIKYLELFILAHGEKGKVINV